MRACGTVAAPDALERREVRELIAAEAGRARGGAGRLVLLRGATGTGRTTVLEAAAEDAAAHGMRVVRARCSPDDTARPFAAVLRLLGAEPEAADPFSAEEERGSGARLWRLLRSYAAEAPLLVAVDDVHLADGPSRSWLVETARRIDRLPVLLVVTERSQYDVGPPSAGLTHSLSPSLVRAHTLAPLSADSAEQLVRSAFAYASRQWVDICVRAGAGSPLLLRALLDDLATAFPTAVPETCAALYPGAYAAAVSWWLDSAGPATAEVARALAALDESWHASWDEGSDRSGTGGAPDRSRHDLAGLLAEMAGADPARVSGWLTATTLLGLLRPDPTGRPRYAHPLLRDAVLAGWSAARRQAAHRSAAEAMLRRGERTETVAGQLLRADTIGSPWALGVLLDSAAGAVHADRAEDAVAYLRRALHEPLPDARRQRLLTQLGSLEYASVHSSTGIARLAEALWLPGEPEELVRAAIALGAALADQGMARVAIEILRGLDDRLTDRPDLARTAHTACALLADQDQTVRQEVYRRLKETAERSPVLVGTAGQALLVRYAASAGQTSADAAMERLRALLAQPADPLSELFLLAAAAAVAQWADELDEATRLVERGLAGRRPTLLHPTHQALLNVRADIAAARGDYPWLLAEAALRHSGEPTGTRGGPAADGAGRADEPGPTNLTAHALVALVETGCLEEARRLADGVDPRDAPDSWELNRFLYARGVLRAARDDPAGALHDFLECGRGQSARDVVSPVVTPWRTAAAECWLALGRQREALTLAEEELRLAQVWNTPRTVGRSLRVLGAVTGGPRGLALAGEAVRVLRNASADTELVSALITRGRLLTAAGERARARDCLREAAEHAERIGAVRLCALAKETLREGGARRTSTNLTGSQSLTAGERRIAELAAAGRTNAEIAGALHLARRTVETHLTHAYRKLGIRRRGELGRALGGEAGG